MKEDPIDVCTHSDNEELKCHEEYAITQSENKTESFSEDASNFMIDPSLFDADTLFADSVDVFGPISAQESQIRSNSNKEENIPREVKSLQCGKQLKPKGWVQVESEQGEKISGEKPDLNISLQLPNTNQLIKAKRKMEACIVEEYTLKK